MILDPDALAKMASFKSSLIFPLEISLVFKIILILYLLFTE